MDILNQRPLHDLLVFRCTDVGRNTLESRHLAGAETTFAGNNHVGVITVITQRNRRDDSMFANRVRQLLQRLFIEGAARLVGVCYYGAELDLRNRTTAVRIYMRGVD